jgi:hypothetical protein
MITSCNAIVVKIFNANNRIARQCYEVYFSLYKNALAVKSEVVGLAEGFLKFSKRLISNEDNLGPILFNFFQLTLLS